MFSKLISQCFKTFIVFLLSFVLFVALVPYGYADEPETNQEVIQSSDEDEKIIDRSADADFSNQDIGGIGKESPNNNKNDETVGLDAFVEQKSIQPQKVTAPKPNITAQAHVADIGWMQALSNISKDTIVGTTGRSKSLEAFTLSLSGTKGLKYRAHVKNIGWQQFVQDGTQTGTTGRALSIEAVEVVLPDSIADLYDVYYRTHVRNIGWLGWAKNGQTAGTTGLSLPIEAINITIVNKGDKAPGSTVNACKYAAIQYQSHIANKGWTSGRTEVLAQSFMIGTTGQSKALEAFRINNSSPIQGGFSYQAHVKNVGWQAEVSNNVQAGTTGRALPIEAVKIRLTGELDAKYDVYYRAHVRNVGWLEWAKDGQEAGTAGFAAPMEAIEVKLVETGSPAPSETATHYINKNNLGISLSAGYKNSAGWSTSSLGQVAGTTGKSMSLSGVKLSVVSQTTGGITYETHNANIGWSGYVSNGAESKGSNNDVQAVRMKLTGNLSKYYDVYYRAHVKNYGWMGWAKNGANSGTTGLNRPIEAYQVSIVLKGSSAPGTTAKSFSDQNGFLAPTKWEKLLNSYYNTSTNQLLFVKYQGGYRANIELYVKENGWWSKKVSCSGFVGKNGINKVREGDKKTPTGEYFITGAYGIQNKPVTALNYMKITPTMYFCGDREYYNTLIDVKNMNHVCSGEHLIKYTKAYAYGLFIDFNKEHVFKKGSAIFIHCSTGSYTAGCVSLPQNELLKVMSYLKPNAKVCIYNA